MVTYNLTSARHNSITINTGNGPIMICQVYAQDISYIKEEIETFYEVL